jgi:hypothetical protein
MKEKIIINEVYLKENITQLLNEAKLNYLYGKDVFFTAGLNQNKMILFQMIGNLGAYANDYEYDDSISVFVLSDSLYNQIKNGFKAEILRKVEKKLNSRKESKEKPLPIAWKNPLVITKSALIDFVKKRTSYYNDEVTQSLINTLREHE